MAQQFKISVCWQNDCYLRLSISRRGEQEEAAAEAKSEAESYHRSGGTTRGASIIAALGRLLESIYVMLCSSLSARELGCRFGEEMLKADYATTLRRFKAAVEDTHLPFLEVRLYEKYFVQVESEQRLENFKAVVGALEEHRLQTLRILKLISEREHVVAALSRKADDFAKQKSSTLEVQSDVLQLLFQHQQVTLRIVEGICNWRMPLTRKYPFNWGGHNYLQKVLDDCRFLDSCELRTILPLRVAQFPLCSNIASLSLFSAATLAGKPKPQEGLDSARLRSAETVIFDEAELQQGLSRELDAIAASGHFVPLLNIPRIVPACATGIRISNPKWNAQLLDAISGSPREAGASHSSSRSSSRSTRSSSRSSSA